MTPRLEISFSAKQQWQFLYGKPYLPQENEFLLNHSRSGIVLALRALGLPQGSRVGMMVYNCHTVMNAVTEAGMTPVFIDINEEMKIDIDDLKRKSSNIQALVVTHLFGIRNNISTIRTILPAIPVIEDCAHAYGYTDYEGDFLTFSIGQGKLPSIGDGGILVVNNNQYLHKVSELYHSLPDYTFFQNTKLYLSLLLRSILNKPLLYKHVTLPLKKYRSVQSGKMHIKMYKMSNRISAIYATAYKSIDELIRKRNKVAKNMAEMLSKMDGLEKIMYGENAFMLVVICENPIALQKELLSRGIDSATHFAQSISWAKGFGYQAGSCRSAEHLVQKLLMLPIYK